MMLSGRGFTAYLFWFTHQQLICALQPSRLDLHDKFESGLTANVKAGLFHKKRDQQPAPVKRNINPGSLYPNDGAASLLVGIHACQGNFRINRQHMHLRYGWTDLVQINRMGLQIIKFAQQQSDLVGCRQAHSWGFAVLSGLFPAAGTKTPLITGFQPGKTIFGHRRRQIIAGGLAEGEEFIRHHRTHRMKPMVGWTGIAASVTKKSGHRIL
jgi:hypothetical protein